VPDHVPAPDRLNVRPLRILDAAPSMVSAAVGARLIEPEPLKVPPLQCSRLGYGEITAASQGPGGDFECGCIDSAR
jgi:hypothetical protein